jgi:hypothetical protein
MMLSRLQIVDSGALWAFADYAVLPILLYFGFCALRAQKPKYNKIGSTLLPQAKTAFARHTA